MKNKKGYMFRVSYASRKVERLMFAMGMYKYFTCSWCLLVDTWKNQVKSMEMGASVSEKNEYNL